MDIDLLCERMDELSEQISRLKECIDKHSIPYGGDSTESDEYRTDGKRYYNISIPICEASGVQVFKVLAYNEEDAVEEFKKGKCELIEEDVEVTSLEPIHVDMVYPEDE